jgi:hypothetical protein
MAPRFALLLPAALLSACAASGDYPSLAPRATEYTLSGRPLPACLVRQGGAATPTQSEPDGPVEPDHQLRERIEALLGEARRGQSEFAAVLPAAEAAARGAGAAETESWIAAQQQISRLEAARVKTQDALAELERLALACQNNPKSHPEDLQRVTVATEEVRALAGAHQSELDRLSLSLRAP